MARDAGATASSESRDLVACKALNRSRIRESCCSAPGDVRPDVLTPLQYGYGWRVAGGIAEGCAAPIRLSSHEHEAGRRDACSGSGAPAAPGPVLGSRHESDPLG